MGLALVAMLADHAGQMQICRAKLLANFLFRLATGAGVRRLAEVHLQFAAARAPEAAVRLLAALQQKNVVLLIEAIEQRGDFVG